MITPGRNVQTKGLVTNMVKINKETLKKSFLYTFVFGIIAHGYAFANFQPSHDSLVEAISNATYWNWKIQLGRYLKPLYDGIFGRFTSFPWTNGLMALVWLTFASYLVVEMLKLKENRHIAIVCGILTTNVTVTALAATYNPDFGGNMCALALTMLGAYIWEKITSNGSNVKASTVWGYEVLIGCCVAASMAVYQVFVFTFITIVLIISILRCLDYPKYSFKKIWLSDFLAAGAAILGGLVYYAGLNVAASVTGIPLIQDSYNSVSNAWTNAEPLKDRLVACWSQLKSSFLEMPGYAYPSQIPHLINLLLIILGVFCLFMGIITLYKKRSPIGSVVTLVLFLILLPFCINGMRLLNSYVHMLMTYSYWLLYILIFCIAVKYTHDSRNCFPERLATILLCCLFLLNIQTANACYVKKSTEQESTLSVMTRVIDKIEDIDGYEPGVTPVAFIGTPDGYLNSFEAFRELSSITGLDSNTPISYSIVFNSYFKMIMRANINVVYDSVAYDTVGYTFIQNMVSFPQKGSIQMANGIVIVKFND